MQLLSISASICAHLYALSSGGPQCPPYDLLHHIWQQTGCYQKDYTEPGWATGQHLHEHIVHSLVVEEWPVREETTAWKQMQ